MHVANAPHTNNIETAQQVIAHARATLARRREFFTHKPKPLCFPKISGRVLAHFVDIPSFSQMPKKALEIEYDCDIKGKVLRIIEIQRIVCRVGCVSLDEMLSHRRSPKLIIVRHIAMMLCRVLTKKSYPEIGLRFGGRDHTTVLSALVKLEPVTIEVVEQIKLGKSSLVELTRFSFEAVERIKPKTRYHRRLSNISI
jgi:hypothetical protein